MNNPKVSVIIPNYNHAHFLKRRIDSILVQTYYNIEVIILDDCSTDNSNEIIKNYSAHPRVKQVIYNEKNSGSPFLQWKKGIDHAIGDWIWIAESDDYADPKFLETLVSATEINKQAGLVYCDSVIVINDIAQEDTFAVKRNKNLKTLRWESNYVNDGMAEIEDYLLPHGTINNTSAVLFNREILLRVNPFDVSFKFIGDKYAFIKVLSISSILYVNQPLNYYRGAANAKPKHTDDFLDYFFEQFLIFNWVAKNLKIINKQKFNYAFEFNSEVSLIKFSRKKIRICGELIMLNPTLFFKVIVDNVMRSIKKIFS